ncbi:MAG: DNA/RNA helicase domain-containing protein [Streptococcus sp.]
MQKNALAIDCAEREGVTKKRALRETKAFISNYSLSLEMKALTTDMVPVEKVAIFDEAQRAWNKSHSLEFYEAKKKEFPIFNQSEPEFLIVYYGQ